MFLSQVRTIIIFTCGQIEDLLRFFFFFYFFLKKKNRFVGTFKFEKTFSIDWSVKTANYLKYKRTSSTEKKNFQLKIVIIPTSNTNHKKKKKFITDQQQKNFKFEHSLPPPTNVFALITWWNINAWLMDPHWYLRLGENKWRQMIKTRHKITLNRA